MAKRKVKRRKKMAAIQCTEKELEKIVGKEVLQPTKKIKIAGNAVVLTSSLKFETIQKMEKYNRDALCLIEVKNDEENEIFRIGTGKASSIGKYGITFMEANKDGFAVATILLPEGVTDKKAYIKDNFGTALFMLNDLEDAVKTACAQLEAAYEKLDTEIEEV
jgi:hypothetical protein